MSRLGHENTHTHIYIEIYSQNHLNEMLIYLHTASYLLARRQPRSSSATFSCLQKIYQIKSSMFVWMCISDIRMHCNRIWFFLMLKDLCYMHDTRVCVKSCGFNNVNVKYLWYLCMCQNRIWFFLWSKTFAHDTCVRQILWFQ